MELSQQEHAFWELERRSEKGNRFTPLQKRYLSKAVSRFLQAEFICLGDYCRLFYPEIHAFGKVYLEEDRPRYGIIRLYQNREGRTFYEYRPQHYNHPMRYLLQQQGRQIISQHNTFPPERPLVDLTTDALLLILLDGAFPEFALQVRVGRLGYTLTRWVKRTRQRVQLWCQDHLPWNVIRRRRELRRMGIEDEKDLPF